MAISPKSRLWPNEVENPKSYRERSRPYTPPRIFDYGDVAELTQMPGGSIDAEGASGKPHTRL